MFFLVPRTPLAHPQRGSPRMFRVDWMEKWVSRVRPWQVAVIWGPVVLYFLGRGLVDGAVGASAAVGLLLMGLLAWTLLEYVLHRWLFHFVPRPGSEPQEDFAFLIHGVHHDYPYDADRLVMPPAATAVFAIGVGWPLHSLVGPHYFAPVFAGLVGGYLWYDLTHYAVHHVRQHTAFGKLQRRNHMLHHFKDSRARYGVTTPLWDVVFRTYPRVEQEGELAPEPAGTPPSR
jgi:sterol desaturase/sphingolipid hydroxylase (fatty acid hydroxylase superfamily)